MNNRRVWRWAGGFGVASGFLILVGQPLYLVSAMPPRLQDTIRFGDYVAKNHNIILTHSLVDALIVAGLLVFLAGLRHLIRQARAEYEWAATLVFGAGVVWGMLVLVGDALESASTLDTVGGQAFWVSEERAGHPGTRPAMCGAGPELNMVFGSARIPTPAAF